MDAFAFRGRDAIIHACRRLCCAVCGLLLDSYHEVAKTERFPFQGLIYRE